MLGLADDRPPVGDALAQTVRWSQGQDVSALAGQPVRLRFALADANVFAMKLNA